jgi:hypothetical protein
MKEFISKYQKAIVGTGAVAVLVVCYFQQKELSKLRAEQKIEVHIGSDTEKVNIIDSLHDELFQAKVQNGRYELSLEHLYEVNPTAAKEFTNFMEHETE